MNDVELASAKEDYEVLASFIEAEQGMAPGIITGYLLAACAFGDENALTVKMPKDGVRYRLGVDIGVMNEAIGNQELRGPIDCSHFNEDFDNTLDFLSDKGYLALDGDEFSVTPKLQAAAKFWLLFRTF